jgi:hypothetical protein
LGLALRPKGRKDLLATAHRLAVVAASAACAAGRIVKERRQGAALTRHI